VPQTLRDITNQPTQTEQKRAEILRVARSAFLDRGFVATNMEQVAERAKVSKQTVYRQFTDKATLFRHVVADTIAAMQESLPVLGDSPADDLPAELRRAARRLVDIVTSDEIVRLRRMMIAEADRFPDISAEWFELGAGQTTSRLSDWFGSLAEAGKVRVDDPAVAAEQFLWLVVSTPLNALMFSPNGTAFPTEQAHRYADAGVDVFLAAYGQSQVRP
jgi:TetR/AcrR family transcriptional repressor of mexJK operon